MNESTLTQLKILVERAVRPVRATFARKRKMRDELLAHVTAVFAEEHAKTGDDRAALEQTRLRFGNAAELTGELQKTAATADAWEGALERLLALRPGESTLRRAGRHALMIGGLILAGMLVFWPLSQRRIPAPSEAWMLASVFLAVCSAFFVYTFVSHWFRQALFNPAGRSWAKAIVAFAVAWLVLPAVASGLRLAFADDVWTTLSDALFTLPFFAVIPFLVAACAWDGAAQIRDFRDWTSLKVD